MRFTITLKNWQRLGGQEHEWACDYWYSKDGTLIGHGDCYYTGKVR